MNETTLQSIAVRVERLERQNRRLKLAALGLFALLAALVLMGQAPKQAVIEAQRFVVRGPDGAVRAMLGTPDDAVRNALHMDERGAVLALCSAKGNVRAALTIGAEGPSRVEVPRLELIDGNGEPRVDVNVGEFGPAALMADAKGIGHVALSLVRDKPLLLLHDPQSRAQAVLRVDAGGASSLTMHDPAGRLRASLFTGAADPGFNLFDAAGKLRIELGRSGSDNLSQGLTLYDPSGTWRALLGVRTQDAVFDLRGSFGGLLNRPEHP